MKSFSSVNNTWNINRYGTLDLALRGVIPILDKRMNLEDEEEEDEEVNDTIVTSEVSNNKDNAKETS